MGWNEWKNMMRDAEAARHILKDTYGVSETFDEIDSATVKMVKEQQTYSVSISVNEIVRQHLARTEDRRDHAISDYFKEHAVVSKLFGSESRVFENRAKISELIDSVTAGSSAHELLLKFGKILPDVEHALRPYDSMRETYLRTLRQWNSLGQRLEQQSISAQLAEQAALSAATWGTSVNEIVKRLTVLENLKTHPSLAASMLGPAFAYGRFASETVTLLEAARTVQETSALSGSLVLADEQIIQITALQETLIEAPDEEEEEKSPTTVVYNLFNGQQRDLLSRKAEVPLGASYSVLTTFSPSAEVFERCRECLALMEYCNAASRTRTGRDIFNPATSWLMIIANLLGNVAHDRTSFMNFALNFYNLLYESVRPRKRLLQESLVTEPENRVIEVLKDFRNKWLVHDASQGTDQTIQEDRRIVADHFAWLGIPRMPVTREEYGQLQLRLLEEIEVFLALLVNRLAPPADQEKD